jgi:hypothetical protein
MEVEYKNDQERILSRAFRLAKMPILLSFVVTLLRFTLEFAGLPEYAIFLIGLLWLTLAYAIYWGIKLYNQQDVYLLIFLSLVIFAPISRLSVVLAWWVDTKWQLGTHYGDFFDTLPQTLLNQGLYGALVQIIPGLILGALTVVVMRFLKEN